MCAHAHTRTLVNEYMYLYDILVICTYKLCEIYMYVRNLKCDDVVVVADLTHIFVCHVFVCLCVSYVDTHTKLT